MKKTRPWRSTQVDEAEEMRSSDQGDKTVVKQCSVVASLLGHSQKRNAVFSCTNTGGSDGLPTLHNQGRRSHTWQHARGRYGGDR